MKLTLIPIEEKYYEFVRHLRNLNFNNGFVCTKKITAEQQQNYMQHHKDEYFICLADNEPAGFVGQVEGDIRVATHPKFFRQGIALFMLDELYKRVPRGAAKIKIENKASIRLFEKAGFKKKFYLLERE
jgi:RimJ/RimL family protein N-acetyltransferase